MARVALDGPFIVARAIVDPRLVRRRVEETGFRLSSPELQEVQTRVQTAVRLVHQVAGQLEQKPLLTGDDLEQSWAARILLAAKEARSKLDEADCALGGAVGILVGRAESPAQAEERRKVQIEADIWDARVRKAMRLLGRVEAATKGEANPYAVGDARKAKEAKRAALRSAVLEAMPELACLEDEGRFDGVVRTIEDEIDPERLADIL